MGIITRFDRLTFAGMVLVTGVFLLITLFHEMIPWWLLFCFGGVITAWHSSFQHEAIHGYPTNNRYLNQALIGWPLLLWLPYSIYRDTHIKHHHNLILTDPFEDPESFYVSQARWQRLPKVQKIFLLWRNSLSGRLLLGSLEAMVLSFYSEVQRLWRFEKGHRAMIIVDNSMLALVLIWVIWVCEIPLLTYFLCFVYPGTALMLLRSFLEHQAQEAPEHRTAIVEAGWFFSMLYLNNNLHALHHHQPALAWHQLKDEYHRQKPKILSQNNNYHYASYWQIIRYYAFRPKEKPVHPFV